MRIASAGYGEMAGLWQAKEHRIVIKRSELRSLETYAGALLHEVAHAESGTPDVSSAFEDALTAETGKVASTALTPITPHRGPIGGGNCCDRVEQRSGTAATPTYHPPRTSATRGVGATLLRLAHLPMEEVDRVGRRGHRPSADRAFRVHIDAAIEDLGPKDSRALEARLREAYPTAAVHRRASWESLAADDARLYVYRDAARHASRAGRLVAR